MSRAEKDKSTDIKSSVMDKISSGEVKMKSKAHFMLLNTILVASASLFTMLSAIFIGLSIRDVRIGRNLRLDEFGSRGSQEFISSLPWLMLLFGVVAIGATLMLVKHFEFTYRHKTTAILIIVMVAVLGIVGISTASGLNEKLVDTPPFKRLNTLQRLADENRVVGTIEKISDDQLIVKNIAGNTVVIKINEKTRIAMNNKLQTGDEVVVFGAFEDGEFKAFGVRVGGPRVKSTHHSPRFSN